MKETSDNSLEYAWEISLGGTERSGRDKFGVYLFKYPHAREITGSIAKLIATAQTSVWDESSHLRWDLPVRSTIEGHKLVLRVADKKIFDALFYQKQRIVHCRFRTPYEEFNYAGESRIEFR